MIATQSASGFLYSILMYQIKFPPPYFQDSLLPFIKFWRIFLTFRLFHPTPLLFGTQEYSFRTSHNCTEFHRISQSFNSLSAHKKSFSFIKCFLISHDDKPVLPLCLFWSILIDAFPFQYFLVAFVVNSNCWIVISIWIVI